MFDKHKSSVYFKINVQKRQHSLILVSRINRALGSVQQYQESNMVSVSLQYLMLYWHNGQHLNIVSKKSPKLQYNITKILQNHPFYYFSKLGCIHHYILFFTILFRQVLFYFYLFFTKLKYRDCTAEQSQKHYVMLKTISISKGTTLEEYILFSREEAGKKKK